MTSRPDTLVIFCTAPTGFGHLRVTHALETGLPAGIRHTHLDLDYSSLQNLHRFTSRSILLREIYEFFQSNSLAEEIFTRTYLFYLSISTSRTYRALSRLISTSLHPPKSLIMVCTHPSVAHEISLIKDRIQHRFNLHLKLCVIVTDDSPQKLWAVPHADYIFVPSHETAKSLTQYLTRFHPPQPQVVVTPYPLSLSLSLPLSALHLKQRRQQLMSQSTTPLNILLPVSGAAVQLSYFQSLISHLVNLISVNITVVSRQSPFTSRFLTWCRQYPQIRIVDHPQDYRTVLNYEQVFSKSVFSLEITKPSEQAFKALFTPRQRGGVILLFSPSIGRQEYDNLDFLRRHHLLPDSADSQILDDFYRTGTTSRFDHHFYRRAQNWRCLQLPPSGIQAARAIFVLKTASIFKSMVDFSGFIDHPELRGDGVRLFWEKINQL